ncbi:ComEC/Rec2 family competence protein [Mucilaginibacter sp. L3T2-6]|uniref:ComEC/Rec2 family competence protein n=1 Tax=Mucilaginibacter sp. L3T2-6 TaxID=3062491 RepID=UPI002674BA4F|nr:ComEC/Rec2 family competence protein [Mucilaginibacter sp. L3T2-6]MDO3641104.1 ComEC/Rec2 family competence protein [Mucilaginibacter sp. L3T2-6]MDV6213420.1 ComEC/Rec2 family competence protein [Mucilaginibacter sp. L3T2-6]
MIANHKGEVPFLILLLPFILGIGLAINLPPVADIHWLTIAFSALTAIFIFLNIGYTRLKIYQSQWAGGALITIILVIAGYVTTFNNNELNNKHHFSKQHAQLLAVKIVSEPVLKNGFYRFTVNVEATVNQGRRSAATGTLLITLKDVTPDLMYGDELLIPAKYTSVNPPFNPAEFNYKRYLANQNIYFQQFLYPGQYQKLDFNKGNPLVSYALQLRQRYIEKLRLNMRDTNAIAVASTLILGYKADLSNDILQAYSKTGTIHVLSVSGAHVAVIYLLLNFVLSFFNRFRFGKLLKAIVIIALIWYYAMLTGFSPAVCRAAVMISMVVIGKAYNRYINMVNIVAISAFGLLLYNPLFIVDVGFQLSYLAVFGLIILQPLVHNWLKVKNKWVDKWLWTPVSVSIAAQVITFPLSAFYFHQFPVYFLITNLFIVIPTEIIMLSGIAYLLLPKIPLVSAGLAYVLEQSILIVNKFLAWIEHLPFASISRIWLTTAEYLLLYGVIIGFFYFLYNKRTALLRLSLMLMLFFCISISLKSIHAQQSNHIAWLNISRHKAIVFKHGRSAVLLTDLKDTDKAYKYSVQPYLDSCQVKHLRQLTFTENTALPWMAKNGGLIQFMDKRAFILNTPPARSDSSEKLKANFIYITTNPKAKLEVINRNFDFGMLIADGTNSNAYVERLALAADSSKTNYKILKRNISLISVSN